jgi:hypothetical protein
MTSQNLRWLAKRPAVTAFAVAFAVALGVGLIQGEKPLYYDSGMYWLLSESFTSTGHFSLLNFGDPVRGYSVPFIYFLLRTLGGVVTDTPWLLVVTFNAALFALIGAVLAPRLGEIAWPRMRWSLARRLTLFGLILVFWRGYLSYPLSDFPALATALLAIVAVSSSTSLRWMPIAGASAALAFQIRPAYILLLPVLIALILWDWRTDSGEASWRRRALCLALFLAAASLVTLPQSLVEHHRIGSYSPIPGGSELASLQYTEGLQLQRYDTFVGGEPNQASMRYVDPHTKGIIDGLEDGTVKSTGQYAEIVIQHPVTMLGVFVRHVVNGLDQRYSTPYVERLQTSSDRIWRFIGFLIVFLALLRVIWPAARRALGPARWRSPVPLLLTTATSIASALDARFLLPVFVLCATLTLTPGWVKPTGRGEGLRRYRDFALIAVAGAAFYAIVLLIVSGATHDLRMGGG